MNELLAALLVVVILITIAAAIGAGRRWIWRPVVAQRVIVQLDTGHAVEGLLLERRGPLFVLADATVHEPGQKGVKADGRTVVERHRVLWVQVI